MCVFCADPDCDCCWLVKDAVLQRGPVCVHPLTYEREEGAETQWKPFILDVIAVRTLMPYHIKTWVCLLLTFIQRRWLPGYNWALPTAPLNINLKCSANPLSASLRLLTATRKAHFLEMERIQKKEKLCGYKLSPDQSICSRSVFIFLIRLSPFVPSQKLKAFLSVC